MRWRNTALVSLGVNVALALVWVGYSRRASSNLSEKVALTPLANPAKTNLVLRRQLFSWRDVESADYPTYIANLRAIGCPEQTIRDIIIADVNSLFARRRALEVLTADQQWWRLEPDTNVVQAAAQKSREMEEERKGLLTRLLGSHWEAADLVSLPRPTRRGILLDGPILGNLPAEAKQSVEEIALQSQDRLQAYLQSLKQEGKSADPAELARISQHTREELQRVLAPDQVEEYLLRYSQTARDLRAQFAQLRFFNPSAEEFRQFFRAADLLTEQIQLLAGADDANLVAQRTGLEQQRETAIKNALGPKRYEEYQLLQDPLYRQAVASAQEAGAPETAKIIYQINLASAEEQQRIKSDTSLTDDQKNIELKQLELEQLKANAALTGKELPPEPEQKPAVPPKKTYQVRPGDSANLVALIYGVPVTAIRDANPNVDIFSLKPGQTLTIPPVEASPLPVRH